MNARQSFYSLLFFGLIAFHLAAAHRSPETGRLGATMPAWQTEIVAGTAPAPYVYRQGVPRLRQALMVAMPPGYAALAVDLGWVLVALWMGRRLCAAWSITPPVLSDALVAVAVMSSTPSDKPEAVAAIAVVLAAFAARAAGRHGIAAAVALLGAFIRPELPIILGAAGLAAGGGRAREMLVLAGGFAYLAAAKFLMFPEATYPAMTPVLMLARELAEPLSVGGLAAIGACLVTAGAAFLIVRRARSLPQERLMAEITVVAWLAASVVFGRSVEVRLFMPVMPLAVLLVLSAEGPHPVPRQTSRTSRRRSA